jgi:hypothetical protein
MTEICIFNNLIERYTPRRMKVFLLSCQICQKDLKPLSKNSPYILFTISGSNIFLSALMRIPVIFLDHAEHSGDHGGDLCCTAVDHDPHPRPGRRLPRSQEVLHALSQGYQGI